MLSEHDRYCGIYGLGMDALVTECSRNTNVIMAWVCVRAKVLENPRQNMHSGPTPFGTFFSASQAPGDNV